MDLKAIQEARMKEIVDIDPLHEVLEKDHGEVSNNKKMERSRAQKQHDAKTNVQPVYIGIGDFVIVRTQAKREYK